MKKPETRDGMLWVYLVYAVMIAFGAYMIVEAASRPFGQWKFPF